ncbi:ribosomal protein S18-alanine N-acetyltransferase [Oceanimonas sp. CHS3-5]|uniref:ribosomal protein S18-alanine N-acetyltransferase n=1 Tax=Oceanimonas sp. CHS3-5 TaxID=3068186 RepID=UPI00273F5718|nr:ribosomal protein S18-alanine N-acetyltransferase [Oceanimonas sp. CHS3-5]MDP5293533.1 ribosomal protein S18-alanine N-acetyltransferase [Oceanimonas sp. CHS3-5]
MQPQFRPLTPADLDAMVMLEQSAHAHPWSPALLADAFGERYFTGALWHQNALLGYFIADRVLDESTLMNICVAPAHQGRGLGRQLLENYFAQCRTLGLGWLWLEVRASNRAALSLYASAGFEESGRRRNYYPTADGHEDAVLMQKRL